MVNNVFEENTVCAIVFKLQLILLFLSFAMSYRSAISNCYSCYRGLSSIDKVPFKSNSMSLGLVLLVEKFFIWMWTQKSNTIMSTDIKIGKSLHKHIINRFPNNHLPPD